jgi:3-oxoacyl-[acyl-carrier-protein] synthase II
VVRFEGPRPPSYNAAEMDRRVVITGVGPVTPVGIGVDGFWDALVHGRSGIGPITAFDASGMNVKVAGEVRDFDPSAWLSAKEIRQTDRVVQMAVAATGLAWADAGEPDVDRTRVGTIFATGIGGIGTLLDHHVRYLAKSPEEGIRSISPFLVPLIMPNSAAGRVSMVFGFTGPSACVSTACATGAHALIDAYKYVRDGDCDLAIAGGSEAANLDVTVGSFDSMQALSRNPDPERACRPFDRDRDGFVLAEGACALVLEELVHARARKARIYAEVAGYGVSSDAYHIAAPEPSGQAAVRAVRMCLERSGESPGAVDYINAHGTSTPIGDAIETRVIKAALGEHAPFVPVSSTKSLTGHMMGAAATAEIGVAALTIERCVIPPTVNYETPDPECDLDYVPNKARGADVRLALSDAFGFGGHNAVVAVRRVGPA